jgi:hypothetical protein
LTTITTSTGSSIATATGGNAGIPGSGGAGAAGGAGGGANAAATTTANLGTATATAAATGGNSAASIGGNGIDGASALATATATGIAATVKANAVGGAGGTARGAGNTGGKGASLVGLATATDSAVATATASSGAASAEATATGGAGGAGSAGAHGGAGGDASLTDAVVGTSSGTVALTQNATGGAGGDSATSTGGAGGSATSTITPPGAPTVNPLTATVNATGGLGGSGATGNAGGAATATIDTVTAGTITTSGGIVVNQSANAYGGDGGSSTTGLGGAGGSAIASDTGTASGGIGAFSVSSLAVAGSGGSGTTTGANGTATATSTANTASSAASPVAPGTAYALSTAWAQSGGASTTLGGGTATATAETANGLLANALARATGGTGTANTTAITSGGLIRQLTATSSAPTDGKTYAGATAEENTAVSGPYTAGDNAYAAAGGLAKFSSLGTNVGAVFNNNPAMVDFGTGSLGAVYSQYATGAQIYTSSIAWDLNTASLPAGGQLDLGLVGPVVADGAFTSLTFKLTEEGDVVVNHTFTSATAANTYFTDDLLNLGTASAGSGGDLNVTASLSETLNGTGSAYGVDFMLGDASCYRAGTHIRTDRGEVRIEALRVGDRVLSALGGTVPVIWLGHRRVDCRHHPKPHDVWPVRVAAGAFAPERPRRDLWLSPDHSVFVDGVLIPIRYLLNDATIVQEPMDAVTYWHVELPAHDVLFAEGLPAETYLDTGNRGAFANGGGAAMLHPDFALRVWEAEACARLVVEGAALVAVRSRLLERAEALGHRTTPDAGLHLVADGRIVRPTTTGGVYCFRLAGGAGAVRLVSLSAMPASVRAEADDHRRLGVAVSRIVLDGRAIPLADARLGRGWHAVEPGGAAGGWRWTDGDAALDVAGGRVLEVEVAITGRYWLAGGHADARAA